MANLSNCYFLILVAISTSWNQVFSITINSTIDGAHQQTTGKTRDNNDDHYDVLNQIQVLFLTTGRGRLEADAVQ